MRLPRTSWALVVLAACKGPTDTGEEYCDPVAAAGADQHVVIPGAVTLDGSASTACMGLDLAYSWTFEQVPVDSALDDAAFGVDNGTAAAATIDFAPDVIGSYVVALTVNDGVTTSTADLIVIDVGADDAPPVAKAGADLPGEVAERVLLDGSESYDPDGAELSYVWSLASAPTGSGVDTADVFDPHTVAASFVPDIAGIYVLSLVVSDGHQWSDPDYVTVDVAADNHRPIADAGDSTTAPPCDDTSFQLNGHGSYDLDGDLLIYQWSVVKVPTGSEATDDAFDDATRPDPHFTWDLPGDYTFQLQVFDGEMWSANDIVTVTTIDAGSNQAPVANAGADQTVEVEADCTSSSYVWTCGDCQPAAIQIDATASVDPDGDSLSYRWTNAGSPTSSGALTISSETSAWTEAYSPTVPATYGTAKKHVFDLDVEAADCDLADTDRVRITVNCTGVKP